MALDAARAAVLAVHAAVGISWTVHRQAARTLRAAEALRRTFVALLQSPLPTPVHAPAPLRPSGAAADGRRRWRPCGKRAGRGGLDAGGKKVDDGSPQDDVMQGADAEDAAPVAASLGPANSAGGGFVLGSEAEEDEGVRGEEPRSGGGSMSALRKLIADLKIALCKPDKEEAMLKAMEVFAQEKVRTGTPHREALLEAQGHCEKFLNVVVKADSSRAR